MTSAALREYHRQYRAKNKARVNAKLRAWKKANPEKVRAYAKASYDPVKARAKGLRRKFGISLVQYDDMRAAQKPGCAICPATKPGGRGTWHVDHDHATKKVRGLLCQNCNIGLGNFKDDPARLTLALAYLRKHGK